MKLSLLVFFVCIGSLAVFSQDDPRQMGIRHYREGQYDRSIEFLTKALDTDKNDRSAWIYLGASYLKMGNKKDAQKAFAKTRPREIPEDGPFGTELKITTKPRVSYTGTTGTVRLIVEFRSDGKIAFVFPVRTVFGLTGACIDAANRIQFTPAMANGEPVTVLRSVEYSVNVY